MEESYDLVKGIFSAKANEGMIAFTAFKASGAEGPETCQGVLKIASFDRPDGQGYLTLTFVVDLEGDLSRQAQLEARFRRANQERLAECLGPDFEMLLEVPLSSFAESTQFFIQELNLYFSRLAHRERPLLEERIVPELARLLDFAFEPLEWVSDTQPSVQGRNTEDAAGVDAPLQGRLRR